MPAGTSIAPATEPRAERARGAGPIGFAALVFFATSTVVLAGLLLSERGGRGAGAEDDLGALEAPRPVTPRGDLTEAEQRTIELYHRVSRSVVHVTTEAYDPTSPFAWDASVLHPESGSGFVWNDRGYIVTNAHVIDDKKLAYVSLADGTRWEAEFVGASDAWDLAVLSIKAPRSRLVPIPVGTSHDLVVGQSVYAIGNPFALDMTLTVGVVSGLMRRISSLTDSDILGVIQIDAAINPGNSGGPLLDSSGSLIGINTAIHDAQPTNVGVGFAVAVEDINREVPRIIRKGFRDWPEAGLILAPDDRSAWLLEKWENEEGLTFGVVIAEVEEGGPAAAAGIRPMSTQGSKRLIVRDVIVGVDGTPVTSRDQVDAVLEAKSAGEEVAFDLIRRGARTRTVLRLSER